MATLDYQTPRPRGSEGWFDRNETLIGWGLAMLWFPYHAIMFLDNIHGWDTKVCVLRVTALAAAVIAVRALVGLIRVQRTYWSLVYVILGFLLPYIGYVAAHWAGYD